MTIFKTLLSLYFYAKNMEINILHLKHGASQAKGLVVVIDVFRAFSTACYMMSNGAERIIPVASVEEALLWKKHDRNVILAGERNERKCEGFDYGNSPTHIQSVDFAGKTVVLTTSAGTQGLVLARNAQQIITGSFVNASAIVRYILKVQPERVSLVSMGYNGERESQEDNFCADYIKNGLLGMPTDFEQMIEKLKIGDGARLLDPANHAHSPASDFDLCLHRNRFNFVIEAQKKKEGFIELKMK
jgi:2-phosphosulfolactate phosphatase